MAPLATPLLSLLHARGIASCGEALGDWPQNGWVPPPPSAADGVEALAMAPKRDEPHGRLWCERSAEIVGRRLSPAGIAYVRPPRGCRRTLERSLEANDISVASRLLHLPAGASPRLLVPLSRLSLEYVLRSQIPVHARLRGAAQLALRLPGSPASLFRFAPSVGIVAHRRGAARPLAWFREAFRLTDDDEIVIRVAWRRLDVPVVLVVLSPAAGGPILIAKTALDLGTARRRAAEGARLEEMRVGAERAGAIVPRAIPSSIEPPVPLAAQSILEGESLGSRIARHPDAAPAALDLLADWIFRWNAATATRSEWTDDATFARVLSPAEEALADEPRRSSLLESLRELAREARLDALAVVHAHNDLSMKNVLELADGRLGILDWEEATLDGLAAADLSYAIYEAGVASDGFTGGVPVFEKCFAPNRALGDKAKQLLLAYARTLGISSASLRLGFLATWAGHARNEAIRTVPNEPRPFGAILRWLLSAPDAWRDWLP